MRSQSTPCYFSGNLLIHLATLYYNSFSPQLNQSKRQFHGNNPRVTLCVRLKACFGFLDERSQTLYVYNDYHYLFIYFGPLRLWVEAGGVSHFARATKERKEERERAKETQPEGFPPPPPPPPPKRTALLGGLRPSPCAGGDNTKRGEGGRHPAIIHNQTLSQGLDIHPLTHTKTHTHKM